MGVDNGGDGLILRRSLWAGFKVVLAFILVLYLVRLVSVR